MRTHHHLTGILLATVIGTHPALASDTDALEGIMEKHSSAPPPVARYECAFTSWGLYGAMAMFGKNWGRDDPPVYSRMTFLEGGAIQIKDTVIEPNHSTTTDNGSQLYSYPNAQILPALGAPPLGITGRYLLADRSDETFFFFTIRDGKMETREDLNCNRLD